MPVIKLHSITEVKAKDKYETRGNQPFKVLCSDMNYYICKYPKSYGFPSLLFNEYLAARFLQIWKIQVPDFVFLRIALEHIELLDLPYHYFDKSCFGSFFRGDCKEVDKFFLTIPNLARMMSLEAKINFLKIAIFDIWLCNEDRHFENFNLLYDFENQDFVPIDHAYIFNTNNLHNQPALISYNESILSSPLFSHFFDRTLQPNLNDIRTRIISEFDRDVSICRNELTTILHEIPLDWNPDLEILKSGLEHYFDNAWLLECRNLFNNLFQIQSQRKS